MARSISYNEREKNIFVALKFKLDILIYIHYNFINNQIVDKGENRMNIKTLSLFALILFLFCGCSSTDQNEDTMISLKDYNSYYSEVLNSSEH